MSEEDRMKIRELIQELSDLDPELEVKLDSRKRLLLWVLFRIIMNLEER
jgi:hypothetical protein